MKTVQEVIQATTAYFQKNGVESARLNIEHLLAHVLGKKRMDLYLEFDRPLADAELEPLRGLVRRRAEGEPLQHLLGTVEFCGRVFTCDKRALVPRPETEQLCEMLIQESGVRSQESGGKSNQSAVSSEQSEDASRGDESKIQNPKSKILDVGTGSGVIALTLAASWPDAHVEAVDVSPDALALARENAGRLGLAEHVRFLQSDLLAGVEGEFDLIVANLPYIAAEAIPALSREVQRDPRMALDGGHAGLEIFARFAPQAAQHLRGRLALEIGHDQAEPLRTLFAAHNFKDIEVLKDYQGRHRFLFAKHG